MASQQRGPSGFNGTREHQKETDTRQHHTAHARVQKCTGTNHPRFRQKKNTEDHHKKCVESVQKTSRAAEYHIKNVLSAENAIEIIAEKQTQLNMHSAQTLTFA
ncbi:unnamed protein product, partial [Ectocarpus sp. 12 AP-2014]